MFIDSIDASGNDHFDCHIVLHAILAAFTAHAGMLHSTKRCGLSEMTLVLRATMPNSNFSDSVGSHQVTGHNIGRQSNIAFVSLIDDLIFSQKLE